MSDESVDTARELRKSRDLVDLLSSIRDADSGSERSVLVKEVMNELAKNVAMAGVLTALVIISIFEVFIGAVNVDNCRVMEMIPVWLMISGSASCLRYSVAIVVSLRDHNYGKTSTFRAIWEVGFSVFWFVWLIFGTYWTYSVYGKVEYDQYAKNYCDHLTYLFTFVLITVDYVMIAVWIWCCFIAFCCFSVRP
ncbi:hypothetical protein OESDEN_19454 [Oesophagostomum dentatum]|uniref:Synaptophysin / synaptoporin n=1 Tax=Oesophagostomum dentatum TaxID=61180 RepID=A0A0B1SAD6_OESDE|nr:hypothetical protein OESDEN_19454 [Oesophagostomum dentatum]